MMPHLRVEAEAGLESCSSGNVCFRVSQERQHRIEPKEKYLA